MESQEYDRMYQLEESYWWFVGRHDLVLRTLRSQGLLRPGCRVLDLGCGTGAMSVELGRECDVVSADLSPLALSYSARRGLSRLCAADAQRLPFRAASFDAVIALDILEHLPDDGAAAREIARVLRPNGRAVITVPAYRSLWSGHDLALMHKRRYVAREVRELFECSGLRVAKLSYAMSLLYPVVWFVRRLSPARSKQEATLMQVPVWANSALAGLIRVENRVIGRADLPFGVTVLCVGRPAAATDTTVVGGRGAAHH